MIASRARVGVSEKRQSSYVQKGMYLPALQIFEQLSATNEKALSAAALGYTLAKLNRKKEARKILSEMENTTETDKVPPQEKALILFVRGVVTGE